MCLLCSFISVHVFAHPLGFVGEHVRFEKRIMQEIPLKNADPRWWPLPLEKKVCLWVILFWFLAATGSFSILATISAGVLLCGWFAYMGLVRRKMKFSSETEWRGWKAVVAGCVCLMLSAGLIAALQWFLMGMPGL